MLSDHRERRAKVARLVHDHRGLLYATLLAAVLLAIAVYVVRNLGQITARPVSFDIGHLVVAFFLTVAGHLTSFATWAWIALRFDMHHSWLHAARAWFVSRLGRYLPGKVPLLLMRMGAYADHSKTKVAMATFVEAYSALSATSLMLVILAVNRSDLDTPIRVAVFLLPAVLLAMCQPVAIRFILRAARKIVPVPELHVLPKQWEMAGFVLAHFLTMFIHGSALFMIFNAVGEIGGDDFLIVTASFYIAGLAGMAAVFAPSGLGVREGTLIVLLAGRVDPQTLVLGVIIVRLVGIASELSLAALFSITASRRVRTN